MFIESPTNEEPILFSSLNGRFSFARLVGNGTIRGGDIDIVAGTGVATVAGGGGVVVVGTKVVGIKSESWDVAGLHAEVNVGFVIPAGTGCRHQGHCCRGNWWNDPAESSNHSTGITHSRNDQTRQLFLKRFIWL